MKLTKEQKFILLKCAEELNELSARLLQAVNKPDKAYYNKICGEIGDVDQRLLDLKELLQIEENFPNYNENKLKLK